MGRIYEDIELGKDENKAKEIVDSFYSITKQVEPRTDIVHREKEISRIDNIINKNEYRSILLVGDKGSGKKSIIEGYVNYLNSRYRTETIYTIDYDLLCDRVNGPADYQRMIESITTVACSNNFITLNLNNVGHILNHKIYGNGGHTFLNKLAKCIREDNMKMIATATLDEYDDLKSNFSYFLDHFTVIHITELTKEQTMDILNNDLSIYEDAFALKLPEKTTKLVCDNADKYIKERPFPEKGEWLMDEVCSNLMLKKTDDSKIVKSLDKIMKFKAELRVAMEKNDYLLCEDLNNRIEALQKRVDKFNESRDAITISESDVLESIGDIVGVKMSRLDENQTSSLQKIGYEIKKNVIGQDDAIDKIVKNIIRNKLGLRKNSHSMGNFIFIGSTGVGKTHLAKQIANQLYGSEENLLRFDMSEYQSEIDVNKLLGSPPGYIGYKESGQLVKRLAKHPESVVLFDEIEKAHPKIYDVLLQLLDEGFITGSDGNKVDATKSLIVFTSNIGVRQAKEFGSPIGFSTDSDIKDKYKEEIIRKALKKRFSPEFLNRLDGVCYFNNLDRESLKKILYREIENMNENIQNICGKTVEITKNVEKWILDKVENEENGARPIIRHLQQNIEEELSTMIVEHSDVLKKNKKVLTAHVQEDKIVLK